MAEGPDLREVLTYRQPVRRTAGTIAVLACALTSGMRAQEPPAVVVRGRVVAEAGAPIRNAVVMLIGGSDSVHTDSSGFFVVHPARSGSAVLRVRAVGFAEQRVGIRIIPESGWSGTVSLKRLPRVLAPVEVVGQAPEFGSKYSDFFRRQKVGSGVFRTRDDIERMGASDLVSVLQGIPGVSISATANPYGQTEIRFRMARCPGQPPNIAIYVNGDRVALFGRNTQNKGSELSGITSGSRAAASTCDDCARIGEVLSTLPVHEIMFVEFYRGGQVPADLGRGDSCAALVVWTR